MYSKTNSLIIILSVFSLLLSGANMYLILNNQTNQQKVNESNQAQLELIQQKLTKINTNITTIDQTIENNFNELKDQNDATNLRLLELKQQQEQSSIDLSSL